MHYFKIVCLFMYFKMENPSLSTDWVGEAVLSVPGLPLHVIPCMELSKVFGLALYCS